mmetsp:Transcript_7732/g.15779  ORF Transcript_7732/g.15779 Transcript_7732/m.15779 type:complete len:276 (-) Transcript_7732:124-951(-)|eukprot:CAMPEP_0118934300 /NCGR_PEP_ID=MMETSP1169-20130426/13748_1 /TAXON_ID=36882 /ORGANISM="Pyramimonas obovata, Strain CCMP722" /LENGTH=275 /DNA_ID=CAMNT_0006877187 /DNA_START=29 /DNA_END=856 /DNA_ORIENTATION=+
MADSRQVPSRIGLRSGSPHVAQSSVADCLKMEDRGQEANGNQPNGFRNLIPRHREERVWQGCGTKRTDKGDRDLMEKERLANRRGGHYRYVPPVQAVLPLAGTGSLAYIDELDRFTRNQAAAEYEQRQQNTAKYYAKIQTLSDANFERERERWNMIEEQYDFEVAKMHDLKATSLATRNRNSVPYNPITLKFNDSHEAATLHYETECIKRRAALRSNKLHSHMHSQSYNLLTNEPYELGTMVPVPTKAVTPATPTVSELHCKPVRMVKAADHEQY